MKIEYKFVTGENVSVEVYGEFEEIMLKLDKSLKNNDRKETRRHKSLDLLKENEQMANIFGDICRNFNNSKVYDAIAKLKPQEQELIHNLYLCQSPISQIELARIKNVSIGSIKMQLQCIKNKLKKLL